MIRSTRWRCALTFIACLALAACNDGGGSSSSNSSTSSAPATTSPGSGSVASTNPAYSISGVVSGITGVAVTLSGTSSNSTHTDSGGNFSFASLASGSYSVAPSQPGYVFTPVSRAETLTSSSVTDLTFAASASNAVTYTISGTVNGTVAAGVLVTLNGTNVGATVTDLSGNYSFDGVVSGTYTVSASLSGYSFTGPVIVSIAHADSAANNFTSSLVNAGSTLNFAPVDPLPTAIVGTAYSSSVVQTISGGSAPYYFQAGDLSTGSPPLGMIVNPNGNLTGTPQEPGQYNFEVCASDSAAGVTPCRATSITVLAAPPQSATPAPTVSLGAKPSTITSGASSVLTWTSTNATACTASGGWTGAKATGGSATVSPTSSTTYKLTCSGANGIAQASTLITVDAPTKPPLPTASLTATATTLPVGASATLQWSSKNATACIGSGGWSGSKPASGSAAVAPTATTTYTVTCSGAGGSAVAAVKITVDAAAALPAPTVNLVASPNSITSGAATTLTWSSTNATACTASNAWSGAESVSGSKSVSPTANATYTLKCSGTGGSAQASATVTVAASGTTTATGTSWVYYDGVMDWPGDYSFVAVADYKDTEGAPLSGTYDAKITVNSPYGGWLPYAQNWDFNSTPYTKLTFALKPTAANQSWSVYFVKVGDIPVGIGVDVSNYGPKPVQGQWATYTIPLADLGVLGTQIYKFAIQDKTGLTNNVFYVDNVGFAP